MNFNQMSNTALPYYYLPPHLLWPRLTVCTQCDVVMTSEFVTLLLTSDRAMANWRTRLRACIDAKSATAFLYGYRLRCFHFTVHKKRILNWRPCAVVLISFVNGLCPSDRISSCICRPGLYSFKLQR